MNAAFTVRRHCVALTLCALVVGCSPALNWREVQLGHLRILLPCKPDTATRTVPLNAEPVAMEMAGCEAGGALFAISRVRAANAERAAVSMAAWRAASLANVQATTVQPQDNSGNAQTSFDVLVDGKRQNGAALQARFKWLVFGSDVYQIAVYADHVGPEQTEALLRELRLR